MVDFKKRLVKQAKKPTAKPKQETKREVATQNQPLSTSISDTMLADAGAGQETMKREDFAIPRLAILQDLSPQVKKTEPSYIKGAEAGQICDVLTGTLYEGEEGVLVIPVSYRRAYIEWKPRAKGGGFVADHGSDGSIIDQCHEGERGVKNVLPNGNTISTVGEYFVFLVMEDGSYTPYVLGLSGSQLKKSRRWNTMLNQLRVLKPGSPSEKFNPAMFYSTFRLTTVPERNDQGSWFGWKIVREGNTVDLPNGQEVYLAARDFRTAVTEGKVTAAAPVHETVPHESEDSPM